MNRNSIIAVVLAVFAAVIIFGGIFLLLRPTASAPSTSGTTPAVQQQSYQGSNSSSVTIPQDMQSTDVVQAAFRQQLPPGDTTQVHNTAVAGGYALLVWSNNPTGGEALLQYDATAKNWKVLSSIGGAFSVAGLHDAGVPQKVVLALLKALNVMH